MWHDLRMKAAAALVLLLAAGCASLDRRYSEPAQGPRMVVDNQKSRSRLIGTDWYCVRDITVDGGAAWGGHGCKIKHNEKKALRLTPGRHRVVLDMISEWGEGDRDVPPVEYPLDVDASKDFAVLLRGSEPPQIVELAAEEPPQASTSTAAGAPPAGSDPFASLEKLKALYDKGVITGDEFRDKKAELLKRIR